MQITVRKLWATMLSRANVSGEIFGVGEQELGGVADGVAQDGTRDGVVVGQRVALGIASDDQTAGSRISCTEEASSTLGLGEVQAGIDEGDEDFFKDSAGV